MLLVLISGINSIGIKPLLSTGAYPFGCPFSTTAWNSALILSDKLVSSSFVAVWISGLIINSASSIFESCISILIVNSLTVPDDGSCLVVSGNLEITSKFPSQS